MQRYMPDIPLARLKIFQHFSLSKVRIIKKYKPRSSYIRFFLILKFFFSRPLGVNLDAKVVVIHR